MSLTRLLPWFESFLLIRWIWRVAGDSSDYEHDRRWDSFQSQVVVISQCWGRASGGGEPEQSHTSPSCLDTLSDSLFPAKLKSHWSLNPELLSHWSSRRRRCRRVARGAGARWRHEAYSQQQKNIHSNNKYSQPKMFKATKQYSQLKYSKQKIFTEKKLNS